MFLRFARRRPRVTATSVYIGALAVLAAFFGALALTIWPVVVGLDLLILLGLAALIPFAQATQSTRNQVRVDISSIIVLAAQPLLGPAGAAVVGLVTGALQGRSLRPRVRLFNAAQYSMYGLLGGVAFVAAGGHREWDERSSMDAVVGHLAGPLVVADIVQTLTNVLLIAGVVRISQGVPMLLQVRAVLRSTGVMTLGYGAIAFVLVILWKPAGLGSAAVAIVLAPLLVAQWAYRQHSEEMQGQQRALEVLVAAIEAKAPHLTGHGTRVADLSGRIAELVGLSPQEVADTRTAGMLHDVGQTSFPTRQVRELDLTDPEAITHYPSTGASILGDLTFLRGALDAIRQHRDTVTVHQEAALPSRIVGLADRYDLLTQVGRPGGSVLAPAAALDILAVGADAELIRALDAALERTRAEEPST